MRGRSRCKQARAMLDPVFAVGRLEGKDGGQRVEKSRGEGSKAKLKKKNTSTQSGTQVLELTQKVHLEFRRTISRFESNKTFRKD